MAALAELGQGLIALAVSAMIAHWLGPTYVLIGALVAAICNALLASVERDRIRAKPLLEEPPGLLYTAGSILLTSLVFGAVWPAIPLIFAWGAWRARVPHDDVG